MRKQKKRFPLKFIVIAAAVILVIAVLAYLYSLAVNLDYFKIKEVIGVEGKEMPALFYLKGKNIFSVDLEKEAAHILALSSDNKEIRLIRVLPDRVMVDFIKRKPLALVRLYRYFLVDENSVLFETAPEFDSSALPVIHGLDTKIFGPKPGKKYDVPELNLAVEIIREFKNNRILKSCSISKVDVPSLGNAAFYLMLPKAPAVAGRSVSPETFEIKIGQDNIPSKIDMLGKLMFQVRDELDNIKYIDLRFKEPTIKPKSENAKPSR